MLHVCVVFTFVYLLYDMYANHTAHVGTKVTFYLVVVPT